MKELIRTHALKLGFSDCRFTTAARPTTGPAFTHWIATGQHATMAWLARNAHKRVDPQQVLRNVRSVVCLAVNYGRKDPPGSAGGTRMPAPPSTDPHLHAAPGKPPQHAPVARYACHEDYHDALEERLRRLTGFIHDQAGREAQSLWYVDTGPVLEREFAQRAGIGFVGKHTNVISRQFGNWILLAEILTTLEFEPDTPERNRCGRCTRCIEACPTRAITAPFQLDARRCISYLTIELKDSIPEELRPAIGMRIFGCDTCLEVCPWNRFARESNLMQAHARADLHPADLPGLLALDNATFKQRFRGTPLERSKRRGLLRNVCVALGNSGDPSHLPALQQAANDPEPLIAEHATWAIHQLTAKRSASE